MLKNIIKAWLLLILSGVFLSACSGVPHHKPTGFLENYEDFRPGPAGGVDLIWTEPQINSMESFQALMSPYKKVMIEPVYLSFAKPESYDEITIGEYKLVVRRLRLALINVISETHQVVDNPGPDVLKVNIALTGLESPNRVLALTSSVLPVGIALSVFSKVATGEHTNVGGASIEASFQDSQTGKVLFAVIDRKSGDKDLGSIVDEFDDAEDAFRWWGERMRESVLSEVVGK